MTINEKAEVLNRYKETISGAYAAGEVVGGIHGANRIGGNAVADIIIFGIQAGIQAAAYARMPRRSGIFPTKARKAKFVKTTVKTAENQSMLVEE